MPPLFAIDPQKLSIAEIPEHAARCVLVADEAQAVREVVT
jgi:hypothetical protein